MAPMRSATPNGPMTSSAIVRRNWNVRKTTGSILAPTSVSMSLSVPEARRR